MANIGFSSFFIFLYSLHLSFHRQSCLVAQTWNLSKKFTPPDFQAKNFTPSISPNFNSFSGKKNTKNE